MVSHQYFYICYYIKLENLIPKLDKVVNPFYSITSNSKIDNIIDKLFCGFSVKKVKIEKMVSYYNYICYKDDIFFDVCIFNTDSMMDQKFVVNFSFLSSLDLKKNSGVFTRQILPAILNSINL